LTTILAIETSCDETAAAVVDDGRFIRSNVVFSQEDLHRQFGGIVPEVTSHRLGTRSTGVIASFSATTIATGSPT